MIKLFLTLYCLFGFCVFSSSSKWESTELIWNLGTAQISDIGIPEDPTILFQGNEDKKCLFYSNLQLASQQKSVLLIYLSPHNFKYVYKKFLSKMNSPYALIITNGDRSFPSECGITIDQLEQMLAKKNLLHIFSQNLDHIHEKLTALPIGLDFHSLAYKKENIYWGPKMSPREQEKILMDIVSHAPALEFRKKRIFVDFQHSDTLHHGDLERFKKLGENRSTIFKKLESTKQIDFFSKPVERKILWETKASYVFSVSPHGNGLDCHRTWEDLALGCIVIVKSSPLDCLYEGLPVVIVRSWDEITDNNLYIWYERYKNIDTNPMLKEKLTSKFWLNLIEGKIKKCLESYYY